MSTYQILVQRKTTTFLSSKLLLPLSDTECVKYYQELLKEAKGNPGVNWTVVDQRGKNVLHIAALGQKVESVKWLLRNVNHNQSLSSARTIEGYTRLEELTSSLEVS